MGKRFVLRSAAGAILATAIATVVLQSPSMAGVWTWEGPFLSQGECEEARAAEPEDDFTKVCTYSNPPGPLMDGWYYHHFHQNA